MHDPPPYDVVVAKEFAPNPPSMRTCNVHEVQPDEMILDVGPAAVEALADVLKTCRTLVWNGPLGAFETPPFDAATVALAKTAAALTKEGSLVSVAGGGDTVAALNHAGVAQDFTFVSTAGGAFLEWMEGRTLPGVAAFERQCIERPVDVDHVVLRVAEVERVGAFLCRCARRHNGTGAGPTSGFITCAWGRCTDRPCAGRRSGLGKMGGAGPGARGSQRRPCRLPCPSVGQRCRYSTTSRRTASKREIKSRYGADGDGPSIYINGSGRQWSRSSRAAAREQSTGVNE